MQTPTKTLTDFPFLSRCLNWNEMKEPLSDLSFFFFWGAACFWQIDFGSNNNNQNSEWLSSTKFILISNETQHANDRFIFHAVVSPVNQLGQGVDWCLDSQTQLVELVGPSQGFSQKRQSWAAKTFHIHMYVCIYFLTATHSVFFGSGSIFGFV